jgi:hypothetical protein
MSSSSDTENEEIPFNLSNEIERCLQSVTPLLLKLKRVQSNIQSMESNLTFYSYLQDTIESSIQSIGMAGRTVNSKCVYEFLLSAISSTK